METIDKNSNIDSKLSERLQTSDKIKKALEADVSAIAADYKDILCDKKKLSELEEAFKVEKKKPGDSKVETLMRGAIDGIPGAEIIGAFFGRFADIWKKIKDAATAQEISKEKSENNKREKQFLETMAEFKKKWGKDFLSVYKDVTQKKNDEQAKNEIVQDNSVRSDLQEIKLDPKQSYKKINDPEFQNTGIQAKEKNIEVKEGDDLDLNDKIILVSNDHELLGKNVKPDKVEKEAAIFYVAKDQYSDLVDKGVFNGKKFETFKNIEDAAQQFTNLELGGSRNRINSNGQSKQLAAVSTEGRKNSNVRSSRR